MKIHLVKLAALALQILFVHAQEEISIGQQLIEDVAVGTNIAADEDRGNDLRSCMDRCKFSRVDRSKCESNCRRQPNHRPNWAPNPRPNPRPRPNRAPSYNPPRRCRAAWCREDNEVVDSFDTNHSSDGQQLSKDVVVSADAAAEEDRGNDTRSCMQRCNITRETRSKCEAKCRQRKSRPNSSPSGRHYPHPPTNHSPSHYHPKRFDHVSDNNEKELEKMKESSMNVPLMTDTGTIYSEDEPTIEGNWKLTMLGGEGGDLTTVPSDAPFTISFDPEGGSVGGYDGCNRFFGSFDSVSPDQIQVNIRGSTRRGCRRFGMFDLQSRFMGVFKEESLLYNVDGNEMTLYAVNDAEDDVDLVERDLLAQFEKVDSTSTFVAM